MKKLTSENVTETFKSCLYGDNSNIESAKIVEGVMMKVGFNPDKLIEKKEDIQEMLSQLPKEFQKSGGGGYTFLNACQDAEGNQWTGLHQVVDELLCLGLAIDKISFPLPKEMWSVLSGGMPYFVVN